MNRNGLRMLLLLMMLSLVVARTGKVDSVNIALNTQPAGASVLFNHKPVGVTPLLLMKYHYQHYLQVQISCDSCATATFMLKPDPGNYQMDLNLVPKPVLQAFESKVDRKLMTRFQPYLEAATLLSLGGSIAFSRLIDTEVEELRVNRGAIREEAEYARLCAHLAAGIMSVPIILDSRHIKPSGSGLMGYQTTSLLRKKRMESKAVNFGISLVSLGILKWTLPYIRYREKSDIWQEHMSDIHVADALEQTANMMTGYAVIEAAQLLYFAIKVPKITDYVKLEHLKF